MGIMTFDREAAKSQILAVLHEQNGLRIPELVERVQTKGQSAQEEALVALIWHMIASDVLRFNATRKLSLADAEIEQDGETHSVDSTEEDQHSATHAV